MVQRRSAIFSTLVSEILAPLSSRVRTSCLRSPHGSTGARTERVQKKRTWLLSPPSSSVPASLMLAAGSFIPVQCPSASALRFVSLVPGFATHVERSTEMTLVLKRRKDRDTHDFKTEHMGKLTHRKCRKNKLPGRNPLSGNTVHS